MNRITIEQLKEASLQIQTDLEEKVRAGKLSLTLANAKAYLSQIVDSTMLEVRARETGTSLQDAFRIQAIYALLNLSHWRHEKAKELKQVLKDYSKQN